MGGCYAPRGVILILERYGDPVLEAGFIRCNGLSNSSGQMTEGHFNHTANVPCVNSGGVTVTPTITIQNNTIQMP